MTLPYPLYQIFLFFFAYAFLGWCTEVVYHAVTQGKVVNRGFLNGPVCPIYGFGMVAILLLLYPLRQNTLLLFLGATLVTTLIELAGGYLLYRQYHTRWWDYSKKPFNLGGYICLEFSLYWGLGALLVMQIVQPAIARLTAWTPSFLRWPLVVALAALMLADTLASMATARGLLRDMEELERLSRELHRVSDGLTQKLGGTALTMDELLDEQRLQLALAKAEGRDSAAAWRQEMDEKLGALRTRRGEVQKHLAVHPHFGARRMLKAFPYLGDARAKLTMQELREAMQRGHVMH